MIFLNTKVPKIIFLEVGLLLGRLDGVLNRACKIIVISSLISLPTLCLDFKLDHQLVPVIC